MAINLLEQRIYIIFLSVIFWEMPLTFTEHCIKFMDREQDTRIQNFIWVKQFQNGSEFVTADKISGSHRIVNNMERVVKIVTSDGCLIVQKAAIEKPK
jgi:hypothetical protein